MGTFEGIREMEENLAITRRSEKKNDPQSSDIGYLISEPQNRCLESQGDSSYFRRRAVYPAVAEDLLTLVLHYRLPIPRKDRI